MASGVFTIAIDRLSHEGRGIGVHDGRTVFVTGALPGEEVEARLLRRRAGVGEAMVERVLRPAPNRVVPPCRFAAICGGCSLQHLAPDEQVAHKQRVVLELLAHQAGVEPKAVLEPLRGPTLGYRAKARLAVKQVAAKGGALIGFREKDGRFLTDMTACPVLAPPIGDLIPALRELINSLTVAARIPQIEVAVAGARAVLVLRHLAPLAASDREILTAFAVTHAIEFWLQPGGVDSIEPLQGPVQPLAYTVDGSTLEFLPSDFTQVNATINAAMIQQALVQLQLGPGTGVVDLFCGLGNFSLPLARHADRVFGFEGERNLVARATANAAANGIGNARFEAVDLALQPERIAPALAASNRLLLDPPRTGADAVLRTVSLKGIERIVYVSCNPQTLARDASLLTRQHGYTLVAAGVMDMFPHTAHVESMGVFAL